MQTWPAIGAGQYRRGVGPCDTSGKSSPRAAQGRSKGEIATANWNPEAANSLMMFAETHDLGGLVGAFQAAVENWADGGLGGNTNQNFPLGNYTAEVNADPGQINRIGFDM
jgi:hypothetical protein